MKSELAHISLLSKEGCPRSGRGGYERRERISELMWLRDFTNHPYPSFERRGI